MKHAIVVGICIVSLFSAWHLFAEVTYENIDNKLKITEEKSITVDRAQMEKILTDADKVIERAKASKENAYKIIAEMDKLGIPKVEKVL